MKTIIILLMIFGLYACDESTVTQPKEENLNGKWIQVFKNDSTKEEIFAFIFKDLNKEIYFLKNDSIIHKTNYELRYEDNLDILFIKNHIEKSIKRNTDGTFIEVFSDHKYIFNLINDTTFTLQFLSNSEGNSFKEDPPFLYIKSKN